MAVARIVNGILALRQIDRHGLIESSFVAHKEYKNINIIKQLEYCMNYINTNQFCIRFTKLSVNDFKAQNLQGFFNYYFNSILCSIQFETLLI